MLQDEPKRATPKTLMALPIRRKDRNDNVLPRVMKSTTDRELPRREMPKTLTALPSLT
jgi:hypothetical protein